MYKQMFLFIIRINGTNILLNIKTLILCHVTETCKIDRHAYKPRILHPSNRVRVLARCGHPTVSCGDHPTLERRDPVNEILD